MGRGDLNICQQVARWGAGLPLLQPQRNTSHWEAPALAMPERAAFLLASARTERGSSTVATNTTGHKKGWSPSLKSS